MATDHHATDISFEELTDYAFGLLPKEREEAVEQVIDEQEEYGEIVDAIQDYCLENILHNKVEFLEKIKEENVWFINKLAEKRLAADSSQLSQVDHLEQKHRHLKGSKIYKLVAGLAAVFLVGIGLFWWFTPKKWDNAKEIEAVVARNAPLLREAPATTDDSWKDYLLQKNYPKAYSILQNAVKDIPINEVRPESAFFLGVLMLYLDYDQPVRVRLAMDYLNQVETQEMGNTNYYLVIGHLLLNQQKEAASLMQQHDIQRDELPSFVRNLQKGK